LSVALAFAAAPAHAFNTASTPLQDFPALQIGACELAGGTNAFVGPQLQAFIALRLPEQYISMDLVYAEYSLGQTYGYDSSDVKDGVKDVIDTFCSITDVDVLQFSTDASTYSDATRLAVSFEGTESDGQRYRWTAEISAADASLPPGLTASKVLVDTTAPRVEILNAPTSLSGTTPFPLTIRFSEDVTGFDLADIEIGNGTASDLVAISADTYTVLVTPGGVGNVTIDVPAGAAEDAAGNVNIAAAQVVVGNTIVADTHAIIRTFMSERAGLIILSQPDLVSRLTGQDAGGPLGYFANGDLDRFTLGFATSLRQADTPALDELRRAAAPGSAGGYSPFDIWVDGTWAHANGAATATDFAMIRLGADYLLTPDLVVGMMGHVDWTTQSTGAGALVADGLGWMAGPYVVARLDEHLYFDASLQGGTSANRVSPLGTYVDAFATGRWLAKAQLTGDFELGALTFSPILAGTYFAETQQGYTDSLGNVIAAQSIGTASLDLGPRIAYLVEGEGVDATPSLALLGNWRHDADGAGPRSSDWSARVEGGLDLRFDNGATFAANAFYSGLGSPDREAYGAGLQLRVPTN